MGPGQFPQYTRRDTTNDEPNSLHATLKSAEPAVPQIHSLKSCRCHYVNEGVAYFEEHPELRWKQQQTRDGQTGG